MIDVRLEQPDIPRLIKQGYTVIDMHLHSSYSHDCKSSVSDILAKAESFGMGVAVTDHNRIGGSVEAAKSGNGVLVIPGVELRTREGFDILLYFYDTNDLEDFHTRFIKPNRRALFFGSSRLSAAEIREISQGYNALAAVAHPYRLNLFSLYSSLKGSGNELLFQLFDCIEVLNGKNRRQHNRKAIVEAESLSKRCIGGSDAHVIGEIGSTVTCVKHADSVEGFLDSVKAGRSMVIGSEKGIMP